jgi:HEAT repeat protein
MDFNIEHRWGGMLMDADVQRGKLIGKLSHKNWRVRLSAVEDIIALNDRSAVGALLASIGEFDEQDTESLVNVRIQTALADFSDVSLPLLINALQPDWDHAYDSWRRLWVIRTLGEIKDARAVEPLIGVLHESEPALIEEAAQALGNLGDVRALEALKAVQARSTGPALDLINQAIKKIVRSSQNV